MNRKCSKCGNTHPLTEEYFAKNQSTNTGGDKYFRPECKNCSKKESKGKHTAYRNAGKPTRPELGTPCQNCGRTDRKLVFDHCHDTLDFRGWLCDNCNRSIGMLGDDVIGVGRACVYTAKSTNLSKKDFIKQMEQLWEKRL